MEGDVICPQPRRPKYVSLHDTHRKSGLVGMKAIIFENTLGEHSARMSSGSVAPFSGRCIRGGSEFYADVAQVHEVETQ